MDTPATPARGLKQALQEAALDGFSGHTAQFDGGGQVTVCHPTVPTLRFSYYWGSEDEAVARVDQHVADNRHRREDDPRVGHEGVYVERY